MSQIINYTKPKLKIVYLATGSHQPAKAQAVFDCPHISKRTKTRRNTWLRLLLLGVISGPR